MLKVAWFSPGIYVCEIQREGNLGTLPLTPKAVWVSFPLQRHQSHLFVATLRWVIVPKGDVSTSFCISWKFEHIPLVARFFVAYESFPFAGQLLHVSAVIFEIAQFIQLELRMRRPYFFYSHAVDYS